jgi:hypothetical protein
VTAGQYDGVSGPGAVTVGSSTAAQKEAFCQNLALLRLKGAWRGALRLDDRNHFLALANRAMEVLDVAMAIQVRYQLLAVLLVTCYANSFSVGVLLYCGVEEDCVM